MPSQAGCRPATLRLAKACSDKMPPSPKWLARKISQTYLIVTTKVSDQTISDKMPKILAWFCTTPWAVLMDSLKAYSGEVPISPYTTPSAANMSAAENF